MGYAFLLNTKASLATFRQKFDIPNDVEVAYCHESEIALHKGANTVFFPLMAILEGGLGFPWTLFYSIPLGTMGCAPTNFPPIFTR